MKALIRLVLSVIAFVAVFYFVFWMPFSLIPVAGPFIATIVSLVAAGGAARYVWRHFGALEDGVVSAMMTGALVTGGIGFVGGFFGPMLFTPDANQGPLLGLFITGPLGVIAGAIGGAVYWSMKGKAERPRAVPHP